MIAQIIYDVLFQMHQQELLLITDNATIEDIVTDIMQQMPDANIGTHVGSWLANILIKHPLVEEVFATDVEINEILQDIYAHK